MSIGIRESDIWKLLLQLSGSLRI